MEDGLSIPAAFMSLPFSMITCSSLSMDVPLGSRGGINQKAAKDKTILATSGALLCDKPCQLSSAQIRRKTAP